MASQTDRFAIHAACREGKVNVVESLLNADPKLAHRKDDDGRLPIHWVASYNQLEIAQLLTQVKNFDPDVQVRGLLCGYVMSRLRVSKQQLTKVEALQDESGWTPLMIAASVKDAEPLVDLLLKRGANIDEKSKWPPVEESLPFSYNQLGLRM
ncbi:putative ankyrin-repeat protein [Sporothrix epigloea]|uniref:Ankyrin-repeat protein n=1 Tax=Sporothrix epigloea TaxID=1892477 RepID=A0ABP0D622_9PEZI